MNRSESKKGKKIALAAILVLLVFVFAFGGYSLAKYTATNTGTDSARVAQWGIVITPDDSKGFGTHYTAEGNTLTAVETADAYAAESSETIVAPGAAGSIKITVTGSAEVAVGIKMNLEVNSDIAVKDKSYNPVKFTLKKGETIVGGMENKTLAEIEAYFDGLTDYMDKFAPGADLTSAPVEYTLSWVWAFSADAYADVLDTQIAAAGDDDSNVSKSIDFEWSVTVDQLAENIQP